MTFSDVFPSSFIYSAISLAVITGRCPENWWFSCPVVVPTWKKKLAENETTTAYEKTLTNANGTSCREAVGTLSHMQTQTRDPTHITSLYDSSLSHASSSPSHGQRPFPFLARSKQRPDGPSITKAVGSTFTKAHQPRLANFFGIWKEGGGREHNPPIWSPRGCGWIAANIQWFTIKSWIVYGRSY